MNQRIEAGQRPPQHPRNFESRQPAISSRNKDIPYRLQRKKEFFATGPEGLMRTVREELGGETYYVPQTRLPHSADQPATVAIASNNSIKTSELHRIFQTAGDGNLVVVRVPEADEIHAQDVFLDATSKAEDAVRVLHIVEDDNRRDVKTRPYVTVAVDQLNSIPAYKQDPETGIYALTFQRHGKPTGNDTISPVEQIHQTFQDMAHMAYAHQWPSVPYLIELATVIHNPQQPHDDAVSIQKSVVFLSREGLFDLAFGKGRFEEYVTRANGILQRLNNGQEGNTSDVTRISSGIELQALKDMGVVSFITGTPSEVASAGFPQQRPEAEEHAYRLALGHADERLLQDYFTTPHN